MAKALAKRAPKPVSIEVVGERIQAARQGRDWTRLDLAKLANVDPSSLYRIEKGRQAPGFETLQRIAKALGLRMDELVS